MKRLALTSALLLALGAVSALNVADARDHHHRYRAENAWRQHIASHYDNRPCRFDRRGDRPFWSRRAYRHDHGWHRGWARHDGPHHRRFERW